MLVQQARGLPRASRTRRRPVRFPHSPSRLRVGVIQAWTLSVAPRHPPDLRQGVTVVCATLRGMCHGTQGRGDGPLANGMEPTPSDFHDETRMRQRSVYGLYNTISLGVRDTPMRAFTEFPRPTVGHWPSSSQTCEPMPTW